MPTAAQSTSYRLAIADSVSMMGSCLLGSCSLPVGPVAHVILQPIGIRLHIDSDIRGAVHNVRDIYYYVTNMSVLRHCIAVLLGLHMNIRLYTTCMRAADVRPA